MNILTDILSLIRQGKYSKVAEKDDVLVLGKWNETPDMTGVASPIPYKAVKLIKISDFKIEGKGCINANTPLAPKGDTATVYQKTVNDEDTGECTVFFRTLKSMSTNLTLALSADDDYVEIDTSGEPNLAANAGTGKGVWKDKVGETLNFKSLVAGSNITIGESTNEITISGTGSSYVLPAATATTLGGVELFSNTVQLEAAEAVSTIKDRTYGLQFNSSGQAVVNVPWITSGGTMSQFSVNSDSGIGATTIVNNDILYLKGGTGINTVGSSPDTVTFNLDLGYTKYVALITQQFGNAPTQIILENNTGRILQWTHTSPGQYRAVWKDVNNPGTDLALVDIDKAALSIAQTFKSGACGANIVSSSVASFNVMTFEISGGGVLDTLLLNTLLEIKIYS